MNADAKVALATIRNWSLTFYEPILALDTSRQNATASLYLILRGIDEIEDHEKLISKTKAECLRKIAFKLKSRSHDFSWLRGYSSLPDVTLLLNDWVELCPLEIRGRVIEACISMSEQMATWVEKSWEIQNEDDMLAYAYDVGGSVGLVLADIWIWGGNRQICRDDAVCFGLYLQMINFMRGRADDARRGICFTPPGWTILDINRTAECYIAGAKRFVEQLQNEARIAGELILKRSLEASFNLIRGIHLSDDGINKP